jgi:hypothetical protein
MPLTPDGLLASCGGATRGVPAWIWPARLMGSWQRQPERKWFRPANAGAARHRCSPVRHAMGALDRAERARMHDESGAAGEVRRTGRSRPGVVRPGHPNWGWGAVAGLQVGCAARLAGGSVGKSRTWGVHGRNSRSAAGADELVRAGGDDLGRGGLPTASTHSWHQALIASWAATYWQANAFKGTTTGRRRRYSCRCSLGPLPRGYVCWPCPDTKRLPRMRRGPDLPGLAPTR